MQITYSHDRSFTTEQPALLTTYYAPPCTLSTSSPIARAWLRSTETHLKKGLAVWNTKCAPFTAASKEPSFSKSASCSSSLPENQSRPHQ